MANTTTGLFQTLVAAASEATQHLQYRNAFLDCVYWDFEPIAAAPYTTLNINIPTVNEGDVVNIGAGAIQPTDTNHSNVQITLDTHWSNSFVIKTWDEIRTPAQLRTIYVQPRLESFLRKINRSISDLVNTTNFADYTLISGAGADVFQLADITGAWSNLANAGVPVDDQSNLFFVTNTTAYGKMLADSSFVQESIVGVNAAEVSRQRAVILPQYGARVLYDQHITNYNSGKQAGIFMHRYAIAAVTRPMPAAGDPSVMQTTIYPRPNLPVQIEMAYSMKDQGFIVHMHGAIGVKVVRSNFASLVETA